MTEAGKMYMQFLERATRAGADGVVVGATQAEVLREVAGEIKHRGIPMPIYSPGIGVQGGDIATALKNGSDYFIVGRSIVEARDPAKAAHELQLRS
jgi:orotidine-5'-phosphate decarboxylase